MWRELEEGGIDDKVRMGVWEKFSENIRGDTHTQKHILLSLLQVWKNLRRKEKKELKRS